MGKDGPLVVVEITAFQDGLGADLPWCHGEKSIDPDHRLPCRGSGLGLGRTGRQEMVTWLTARLTCWPGWRTVDKVLSAPV